MPTHFIYSPACPDRVHIGRSEKPQERVCEMNLSSPVDLELFGTTPYPVGDVHGYFDRLRTKGGWFVFGKEIKEWIKENGTRYVREARRAS